MNNQHLDTIKTHAWIAVAHLITPIVKFIGKVKPPFSEKKAIEDYHEMVRIMKPLDLILSNTRGHLSNVMNPGYWKHTIVYIGKENGIPMIIEAIGAGVVKRPLVECLAEKDEICVLRYRDHKSASKKNIDAAIKWANKQVGKEYDYTFDLWSDHKFQNFYCSEFGYYTHKNAYKKYSMELRESFGVPTITPTDFFKAKDKYQLLLRTRN